MVLKKIVYGALLALATTAILVHSKEEAEAEKSFSVELTSSNFNDIIKKNNHFVMFYAPWCGHCKRLHPLWEQLAEMMNVKEDAMVRIAKVDCTVHKSVCKNQQVTGYPTLIFFKLGNEEPVKFKGMRDMPSITSFISEQLQEDNSIETSLEEETPDQKLKDVPEPPVVKKKVIELTEENFAKHVSSGNHFVKFYAPWCGHCQNLAPTWTELAESIENTDSVIIAKIDCTVHRPICQDFDVKGYPTLLWIEDGKKIEKYSGNRDFNSLQLYIAKMSGTADKVQPPPSVEEIDAERHLKVKVLTGENFDKIIKEGITIVKFYAPWCGHCQELQPTWEKLAAQIHDADNGVTIAKLDCTTEENKNICNEQEVEGYPSIFAYKNGERQPEYNGSRSLSDLVNFVNKIIGRDEL